MIAAIVCSACNCYDFMSFLVFRMHFGHIMRQLLVLHCIALHYFGFHGLVMYCCNSDSHLAFLDEKMIKNMKQLLRYRNHSDKFNEGLHCSDSHKCEQFLKAVV